MNAAWVFKAMKAEDCRYLWFMDASVYALFAPFVRKEQRIIYQPHCPELPWLEVDASTPAGEEKRRAVRASTEALFDRADHLVFPNAGAATIYRTLVRPRHRVHFLESGAAHPPTFAPIPLDPAGCYFLYIGRRNAIKGFDRVLAAFRAARRKREEIRLLVSGAGEPIDDQGVVDIGFTARVHAWIAASDCVVNANRQSYFDLSVLETLAVGTPIALTMSEGHASFARYEPPGIISLPEPVQESLERHFLTFTSALSRNEQVRAANRRIYREGFSPAAYHRRLGDFVRSVVDGQS